MSTPPQRVRVTRSRRPVRSARRRTVREEIVDESRLGSTYVNSLRRAQLHLSLGTIAVGLVTIGALPLLFALVPALRGTGVMGLPFAWVVLGLLVYPAVVLTARWYVRATERLEADFSELVSRR
ncbi:hypothetical protein ACQBJO_14080 [Janibacter sp. G349]|uniref:hypothetical protein n=1 Tax=unclassified Janibacter TaxID=2649294 RepID=UPI003B7FA5EF